MRRADGNGKRTKECCGMLTDERLNFCDADVSGIDKEL